MRNEIQTNTTQIAKRFSELIKAGVNAWLEAGRLVAEGMEHDPEFADRLVELVPGLTYETVMRFNAIGTGVALPEVFLHADRPGIRRLARLPVEVQRKLLSSPISTLVRDDTSGGWGTLQIDVLNLTTAQSHQVFGSDGIRSEAAQRAWLEDRATREKMSETVITQPYSIRGRKFHVNGTGSFTLSAKELAQILAKMED